MSSDSDFSLEVQVTSKNHQFIIPNQLILIKSDSSTTCWDIINSFADKSSLLQHILTYIRHYSSSSSSPSIADEKSDEINSDDYIEIIAIKDELEEIVGNVPMRKALYPLLNRHKWKSISFLIKQDLVIQSKLFLQHIDNTETEDMAQKPTAAVTNNIEGGGAADVTDHEFEYKRFFNRSSPISAFNSLSEIASLYHIFGAVLIIFLTGILTNEALEKGVLYRFDLLRWNFDHLDKVFLIWCGMFAYSFVFVMLFHSYKQRSIDRLNFGVCYIFLLLPLLCVPFKLIRYLNLPIASAAIVSCESVRFTMKIHAYIFEMFRACHYGEIYHNFHNLTYKNKSAQKYKYLESDWIDAWKQCLNISKIKHLPPTATKNSDIYDNSISSSSISHPSVPGHGSGYSTPIKLKTPDININTHDEIPIVVQVAHLSYNEHVHSFLNFIFCPSLVYRWRYPTYSTHFGETHKINWGEIFFQILNMMGCLLFVFVVFYHQICPSFMNTPYEPFTVSSFLSSIFSSAIPGMLLVVMCFFGVIHCWLNMWCELLGYCDRVFYEDWWNATTFAEYSKKWNLVVYNWSHNYFFLPMLEAGYSKDSANLVVFLIWSAVQEYVFTCVAGTFYPVLLGSCIVFGLLFYSVPFMDKSSEKKEETSDLRNVAIWMTLFLQNGFFVTVYAREWYAFRAAADNKLQFNENSIIPYSWQLAIYPNISSTSCL